MDTTMFHFSFQEESYASLLYFTWSNKLLLILVEMTWRKSAHNFLIMHFGYGFVQFFVMIEDLHVVE